MVNYLLSTTRSLNGYVLSKQNNWEEVMLRNDVKVGRRYTPSPPLFPEQDTLDFPVKAYWMERMDTDLKKFHVIYRDLRQIQQIFRCADLRQINQMLRCLDLRQFLELLRVFNARVKHQEIEVKLQEIGEALKENAVKRQKIAEALKENAIKRQKIAEALKENAAKRQENKAILNEIQELKHLTEDLLRNAKELAAKIQASIQSAENDPDDDLEEFMANVERKRAARARKGTDSQNTT